MTITLTIGGESGRIGPLSRMEAVLDLTRRAALGRAAVTAAIEWTDNMGYHREATVTGDAESVAQLVANLKLD